MSQSENFVNINENMNEYFDVTEILKRDNLEIDYLFEEHEKSLRNFNIMEAERNMAMDNLRKLTTLLQTRRLRYKAREACKYFTL